MIHSSDDLSAEQAGSSRQMSIYYKVFISDIKDFITFIEEKIHTCSLK